MKKGQKNDFETPPTLCHAGRVFEAERADLLAECEKAMSECPGINCPGQETVGEMIALASKMADLGTELTVVTRCLNNAARQVEDAGRGAQDAAQEVHHCALWLDDLTSKWDDTTLSLLWLARDRIPVES